ncbi:MAG: metallophosphoesterase family protein [Candidatus Omnitrophota bacterium]
MKQIILSDIHANIEALTSVLLAAEKEGEIAYCLGDIIGYGPNPSECFKAMRNYSPLTLMGNHEFAVLHPGMTAVFNPEARKAIFWTAEHAFDDDLEQIRAFPLKKNQRNIILLHSNLIEPERWHYLNSDEDLEANLRYLKPGQVCFFGHTHIPGVYCLKGNRFSSLPIDKEAKLESGNGYLINVGSVGQPRDKDPRAAYCVFDPDANTIAIRRVNYDFRATQRKIIDAGLPAFLASRLSSGT